jgi:hypothetical protein
MADNFYQSMQSVASSLIADFAQGTVEYVELTPVAGATADDPGTPTETATTINAVARGVKFKYIDGTDILASDLQLTMPGGGVVPNMRGFIRVGTVRYKIVSIKPIPPFGTTVACVIVFRK